MKIFLVALMLVGSCCGIRAQDVAVVDAKVYTSPDSVPLNKASVLIRAGKITAVGRHLTIPPGVKTLPCDDCVVLAGFWNTHVHFMEPKWADAAHLPAEQLTRQLQEMLTHSGFTTVVDLGSDPSSTMALRRRIESGEVAGPHIYTAGIPLYPEHALPFYLKGAPPSLLAMLGQPATPAEADTLVERNIARGTDVVKLFTGTLSTPSDVVPMRLDIVRAAVEAGHRHGQLVFAHSSNLEGTRIAMEGGVDVLAHAPEKLAGIDDGFIAQLVAHHMVMVPTLKLFSQDADIAHIRAVVGTFHRLGGPLMFGTDTGFMADYDMTEEYRQLYLAGLNYREVLAMLTTSPAQRFHVSEHKGRVAVGMNGDLTILSADPASGDPTAFTRVRYTVRNGRVIYRSR